MPRTSRSALRQAVGSDDEIWDGTERGEGKLTQLPPGATPEVYSNTSGRGRQPGSNYDLYDMPRPPAGVTGRGQGHVSTRVTGARASPRVGREVSGDTWQLER